MAFCSASMSSSPLRKGMLMSTSSKSGFFLLGERQGDFAVLGLGHHFQLRILLKETGKPPANDLFIVCNQYLIHIFPPIPTLPVA